jgi:competence protein ComEA
MHLVFRSSTNADAQLTATSFVGRTPASAAGPLAGHSDFVKTSTIVARTLVSAASRIVSTLFAFPGDKHRDESRCGTLKAAPWFDLRWVNGGRLAFVLTIFAAVAWAQLADGPGKEETLKLCSHCHELERSISLRQDRDGWQATVDKMVRFGARATDKDFAAVVEYLTTNFPGDQLPKLNVNKAAAIDFESRLSLKRSEAAAIIAYRARNGPFKSIEDLKRVPSIDAAKIEAKKDVLTF